MTQQEFFARYIYSVRTDKIGGGTFGTVYKAYDNLLNRDVAIKVSEVKVINGKEFSLKDEFEAIKELPKHPNIANYEELYTFEFPQGVFDHAVMQFYQDGNLSAAIHGQMSQFQKEQVCIDLLQGIIHLHKHNVVHRDLKPGNILVVKRGDKIIPVITDFGLSKQVFQDGQSRFSNSFGGGTLKYSSPEQLRGEELRLNTDLWSYGVIVHQIFTGKDLFFAQNQSSGSADAEEEIFRQIKNKDISADLAQLPAKWEKVAWLCLERNPAIRVKSAEELLSILSGSASTPTPPKQPKTDEETKVFNKQQSGQNHSNDSTKIEEVKPETRNPKPETTPPPEKKKNKFLIPAIIIGVLLAVVMFIWQPWGNKTTKENIIAEEVINLPSVVTGEIFNIEGNSANVAFMVVDSGGGNISESGVMYSLKLGNTIAVDTIGWVYCLDYKSGDTSEIAVLSNLEYNSEYVVRAYAINEAGTGYGNELSFTTKQKEQTSTSTGNAPNIQMVYVSGGTFTMGCTSEQGSDCYDSEKPDHSVTLSSYYIGKYEVTQGQWKAVMGSNPSASDRGIGDNYPVNNVSWNDIQTFLTKLNQMTGKRYRLPTEAEWEYAARGGSVGSPTKYAGSGNVGSVAWYSENSGSKTHPVGQKSPNELGIYDMSGNVWEWCSDWYKGYPGSSGVSDYTGSRRVLRGGSWINNARLCRVSYRSNSSPDYRYDSYGFRLVLAP